MRITPADEASIEDFEELFGSRGPAATCWCQRYRLRPKEAFSKQPAEERRDRFAAQVSCRPSRGLIAWDGNEIVGWCAVGPRNELIGLTRVFTVPWKGRDEDRSDPSVWAVTCFFTGRGHRKQGIGAALAAATVGYARDNGAAAVEGYPIVTTDVITDELHVGTVPMFAAAGYRQVSAPTPRRVVMRLDL